MALDPWTALSTKQGELEVMQSLGLHVMKKEWALSALGAGRVFSTSLRRSTLTVHGSEEEMTIPVQTCTTVRDVKCMLAERLMIPVEQLSFVYKQGCFWRSHKDIEQIASKVFVKGIRSFKPLPCRWPYPIGMLGAGYMNIRAGLKWLKDGSSNFVIFDRLDRIGGYCWLKAANRHSRLQSEFASFCAWYGPEFGSDERCGGVPKFGVWDTWPDREEVQRHFQVAAEEYGLLPHCRLSVSVDALEIVGRRDAHDRCYDLTLNSTVGKEDASIVRVSGLISAPGSMAQARVEEFPGEDAFDGHIAYGMHDDLQCNTLKGSQVAVVGSGAFAAENVRTCTEHGARKVYVVARRKNLLCPRLPCWFVHQGSYPVPGILMLRHFEPMYKLAGLGDPFDYDAVHGSRNASTVLISQASRFAISDVIFLAAAYGRLKYIEATVKRLTTCTLCLSGEGRLENISVLIKALGFVGDFRVDRLHRMKQLKGFWPDADYRRPIRLDAQGMHASNFENMSQGLPSYYNSLQDKFFFDFPREHRLAVDRGLLEMLPVNEAEGDRPAYLYDIRYLMLAAPSVQAMCPKIGQLTLGVHKYKRDSMLRTHPLREHLRLCREEWDKCQQDWRAEGFKHAHVPYPYTETMVDAWHEEHKGVIGSRTVDDAVLASMNPTGGDAGYLAASQQWWTSHSVEAQVAWREGRSRPTMTASKRAKSAG